VTALGGELNEPACIERSATTNVLALVEGLLECRGRFQQATQSTSEMLPLLDLPLDLAELRLPALS
jgi:hypothetical protein